MKIESEKMNEMLFMMRNIMYQQVLEGDYSVERSLWEYAECTNNMIHPINRGLWNVSTNSTEALMCDAVNAICRRAREDGTIVDEFHRIMMRKYPDAAKECAELKVLADSNKILELEEKMEIYWQHADMPDMDIPREVVKIIGIKAYNRCTVPSKCIYYTFLIYYLGVDIGKAESGASFYYHIWSLMLGNITTEADYVNYDYVYDNGENVFSDIEFRRYIDLARKALAEYLNEEYEVDVVADEGQHNLIATGLGSKEVFAADGSFLTVEAISDDFINALS